MAYITKEQVAEKRKALKAQFPEIKFSVRREHCSSLNVSIVSSPYDFGTTYEQINKYYIDNCGLNHIDILKKVNDICMQGNYNNSDAMTDYFDIGFYFHLQIGAWDKPYVQVESKKKILKK